MMRKSITFSLPIKPSGWIIAFILAAGIGLAEDLPRPSVDPSSDCGLDYYSQGGVVVDGVAYFTANDYSRLPRVTRTERFPCVVAFDVTTFRKIRSYPFTFTYDSTPLVFRRRAGTTSSRRNRRPVGWPR